MKKLSTLLATLTILFLFALGATASENKTLETMKERTNKAYDDLDKMGAKAIETSKKAYDDLDKMGAEAVKSSAQEIRKMKKATDTWSETIVLRTTEAYEFFKEKWVKLGLFNDNKSQ